MITAIIILSAVLALALLIIFVLYKIVRVLVTGMTEIEQLQEELAFVQGKIDIPEEQIAQKFLDVILLCHIEKNPNNGETWKIVDTSNYMKNHIIGLTYFVQPQLFDEIKNAVNEDNLREQIRADIIQELQLDENELDSDFVNDILNQAMNELVEDNYQIDEEHGAMTRPLLPHCTVYQLKDGRWLWRQEYKEN